MSFKPAVQRKAASGSAGNDEDSAGGSFRMPEGVRQNYSGEGRPLPDGLRSKMEEAFGADFSDVRVHEGDHVPELGAQAFTEGSDIHFAPGQFDPDGQAGQELIGHELTHVVQQRAGRVSEPQGKGGADSRVNEDPSLESEADRLGSLAARGQSAQVSGSGGGVMRKAIQLKGPRTVTGRAVNVKVKATNPNERAARLVEAMMAKKFTETMDWLGGSTAEKDDAFQTAYKDAAKHAGHGMIGHLPTDLRSQFSDNQAKMNLLLEMARFGRPSPVSDVMVALGKIDKSISVDEDELVKVVDRAPTFFSHCNMNWGDFWARVKDPIQEKLKPDSSRWKYLESLAAYRSGQAATDQVLTGEGAARGKLHTRKDELTTAQKQEKLKHELASQDPAPHDGSTIDRLRCLQDLKTQAESILTRMRHLAGRAQLHHVSSLEEADQTLRAVLKKIDLAGLQRDAGNNKLLDAEDRGAAADKKEDADRTSRRKERDEALTKRLGSAEMLLRMAIEEARKVHKQRASAYGEEIATVEHDENALDTNVKDALAKKAAPLVAMIRMNARKLAEWDDDAVDQVKEWIRKPENKTVRAYLPHAEGMEDALDEVMCYCVSLRHPLIGTNAIYNAEALNDLIGRSAKGDLGYAKTLKLPAAERKTDEVIDAKVMLEREKRKQVLRMKHGEPVHLRALFDGMSKEGRDQFLLSLNEDELAAYAKRTPAEQEELLRGAFLEKLMSELKDAGLDEKTRLGIKAKFLSGGAAKGLKKLRQFVDGKAGRELAGKPAEFGKRVVEICAKLEGDEFMEVREDRVLVMRLLHESDDASAAKLKGLFGVTDAVDKAVPAHKKGEHARLEAEMEPRHWSVKLDLELDKSRLSPRHRQDQNEVVSLAHRAQMAGQVSQASHAVKSADEHDFMMAMFLGMEKRAYFESTYPELVGMIRRGEPITVQHVLEAVDSYHLGKRPFSGLDKEHLQQSWESCSGRALLDEWSNVEDLREQVKAIKAKKLSDGDQKKAIRQAHATFIIDVRADRRAWLADHVDEKDFLKTVNKVRVKLKEAAEEDDEFKKEIKEGTGDYRSSKFTTEMIEFQGLLEVTDRGKKGWQENGFSSKARNFQVSGAEGSATATLAMQENLAHKTLHGQDEAFEQKYSKEMEEDGEAIKRREKAFEALREKTKKIIEIVIATAVAIIVGAATAGAGASVLVAALVKLGADLAMIAAKTILAKALFAEQILAKPLVTDVILAFIKAGGGFAADAATASIETLKEGSELYEFVKGTFDVFITNSASAPVELTAGDASLKEFIAKVGLDLGREWFMTGFKAVENKFWPGEDKPPVKEELWTKLTKMADDSGARPGVLDGISEGLDSVLDEKVVDGVPEHMKESEEEAEEQADERAEKTKKNAHEEHHGHAQHQKPIGSGLVCYKITIKYDGKEQGPDSAAGLALRSQKFPGTVSDRVKSLAIDAGADGAVVMAQVGDKQRVAQALAQALLPPKADKPMVVTLTDRW